MPWKNNFFCRILESLKYAAEHALKKLKLWEYFLNLPELALPRLTLSTNAVFTGMDNFIRADVDFTLSDQWMFV